MSTQRQEANAKDIVAALHMPGAGSWGVANETIPCADVIPGPVTAGRSEAGDPLLVSDRPTLTAMRRIQRENELLINHAAMVASALGACPNCWGTISDCEECGGHGSPGAREPDRACFEHFVMPVINRLLSAGCQSDVKADGQPWATWQQRRKTM